MILNAPTGQAEKAQDEVLGNQSQNPNHPCMGEIGAVGCRKPGLSRPFPCPVTESKVATS